MWQLKIEDPQCTPRKIRLRTRAGMWRIGPSEDSILQLPGVDLRLMLIRRKSYPHEFIVESNGDPILVGDVKTWKSHLPPGIPMQLGPTKVTLVKSRSVRSVPRYPSGVRKWKTISQSGSELLWLARKAADTTLPIYLEGETGTGKEILSRMIHAWSSLKKRAFVPLHCATLPPSLAESELFGHVKGAFTGAVHQRTGALMKAHGGTLFLDEVGDLPSEIQIKLLRFLEDGEIKPVGSDHILHARVRLICATHKPLAELVEMGKFRRDLYFRLCSIPIPIPSLRKRSADISFLAWEFASAHGKSLTPGAIRELMRHPWPGNVRELRHAVERACGFAGPWETVLRAESFQFLLRNEPSENTMMVLKERPLMSFNEMEKFLLDRSLEVCRGNRSEAAKMLGVARSTLFSMIKRHARVAQSA